MTRIPSFEKQKPLLFHLLRSYTLFDCCQSTAETHREKKRKRKIKRKIKRKRKRKRKTKEEQKENKDKNEGIILMQNLHLENDSINGARFSRQR